MISPNPNRNAEIIRRRTAGEWPRAIAKDMGLTPNTVIGVCNRAGLSGAAGKALCAHGEAHFRAKLTDADVAAIRRDYVPGDRGAFGQAGLARLYGVAEATIWYVLHGLTWRHVA